MWFLYAHVCKTFCQEDLWLRNILIMFIEQPFIKVISIIRVTSLWSAS